MNRSRPARSGSNRGALPPRWAIITAVLVGLTMLLWFNPVNWSNVGDALGALAGLACFVGLVSFVLWGVVWAVVLYVKNYRIALPATAVAGLGGVVLWQILGQLGPAWKWGILGVAAILVVAIIIFIHELM